jgi:iron complex transport system ATP-binding protein
MLEASQLTVKYGPTVVVADVTLALRPGEVTAIIGPNGAGKSTLLQTFNGRLRPAAGRITLDGHALETLSRQTIARHVAVVAQEAELRFPVAVLEFVLGGRFAWASHTGWGWETARDLQIAEQILSETELLSLNNRLMNELSGGERQRAVLARALATEAKYLLLDEPTANLDLSHQAGLLELVRKRCQTEKASALVVTHDVNLAAEFADNILAMKDGKAIQYGPPGRVLTANLLHEVFGVSALVDAHPTSGAPRVTPVYRESG